MAQWQMADTDSVFVGCAVVLWGALGQRIRERWVQIQDCFYAILGPLHRAFLETLLPHALVCPPALPSKPVVGARHGWRARGSSQSPCQFLLSGGFSTRCRPTILWQACQSGNDLHWVRPFGWLPCHPPPILLEGILGGRIPKYQGLEFLAAVRAWESLTTPVSLSLLQREGRVISFGYAQRERNSCRWLTPDCTEDTSSGGQGGREWFLDLREEPFG